MELGTLLGIYIGIAVLFIAVLLFGELEFLQGTPISWLHWLITDGMLEGGIRAVAWVGGERGTNCMTCCYERLFERRNPILQIFYASLLLGAFTAFAFEGFPLLPNPAVGEEHINIGGAFVLITFATFIVCSVSDPGVITEENVETELAARPPDNVLFPRRNCPTCSVPKPARSKHCGACNQCVARFDHHCAWVNNCIGRNNHRYFILFVACTTGLCVYGGWLGWRILLGEAIRFKLIGRVFYIDGEYRSLKWTDYLQWAVTEYPALTAASLFAGLLSLFVAGFLGYQLVMVGRNVTANESAKWADLKEDWNTARRAAAHLRAEPRTWYGRAFLRARNAARWATCGMLGRGTGLAGSTEGGGQGALAEDAAEGSDPALVARTPSGPPLPGARPRPQGRRPFPKNPYDRGLVRNFLEVFFPERFLREATKRNI